MRVLYVLFEGFDTENGTNHLALKTMTTLMANGISVHLITSHSTGLYPDIPPELLSNRLFSCSVIPRDKVEKRDFKARYLDGMRYFRKASEEWRKERGKTDVVILQSTPTVFWGCLYLRKDMKNPIIFNSFDVFPDGPFLFGAIKNYWLYKILKVMQKYVYAKSSKIVVISEDMKTTFLKEGIPEEKLIVIHNWYNSKLIKRVDEPDNIFVNKYNIDTQKFIVQYAGNFGYTFDYKQIIEIAERLRHRLDIQIHLIGSGGFTEVIKSEVEKRKLSNIVFFPWQPSNIIADVYSACDLELIPLSKGVIYTSFPSKCALLMACKKTFLCMTERDSYFYKQVNERKIGICVEREDYDRAAFEIQKLADDRSLLETYGQNAFAAGREFFSSDVNVIKYVKLVENLAERDQL